MDIWQPDKLVLFLVFFIPGFISIKVYDLLVPSERRDFSKSLFEAIGYSSLNFAVLSWLIILIHSKSFYSNNKAWYLIILFLIICVVPVLWPILYLKLSSWRPIAKYVIHPFPKPWDYLFSKREAFWVIVHLKDGRRIGGKFATNSISSSFPSEEQIYLEEVWKLSETGEFEKPIERSRGIIILGKEISSVEFFK